MEFAMNASICWNCQGNIDKNAFCPSCGKIQYPGTHIDYFQCLELSYKLVIDPGLLEKRYYRISRLFHPDFFTTASEKEKSMSLEWSSIVNKSYDVLRSPIAKTVYLTEMLVSNQSKKDTKKQVSPEVLLEMMEIQEVIEETHNALTPENKKGLREKIFNKKMMVEERIKSIEQKLDTIFRQWDSEGEIQNFTLDSCTDVQKGLLELIKKESLTYSYLYLTLKKIDEVAGE